jgi:hypothetical protein
MRSISALLALLVFSAAAVAADAPAAPAGHAAAKQATEFAHKGKVLSSINASIYTYIEVADGAKTVWLAAPTVTVKKGDTVGFDDGSIMTNFFSKSLNRTFETVIFVAKVVVLK